MLCEIYFPPTKWRTRSLTLHELFRLWDYPVELITSIWDRHRQLLYDWKGNPIRVLGTMLHFFSPVEGRCGGVIDNGASFCFLLGLLLVTSREKEPCLLTVHTLVLLLGLLLARRKKKVLLEK